MTHCLNASIIVALILLMYLGSLTGIYLGACGTRAANQKAIRAITGRIILAGVISRAVAIPMYHGQPGHLGFDRDWDTDFNTASKSILFISGVSVVKIILYSVVRTYVRRQWIQASIAAIQG